MSNASDESKVLPILDQTNVHGVDDQEVSLLSGFQAIILRKVDGILRPLTTTLNTQVRL